MDMVAGSHAGPAAEGPGPSLPWLGLGAATLVADERFGESPRECGAYQREKQTAARER
jgi:hypothetical protein